MSNNRKQESEKDHKEDELYDELSRLNNELINMQRELEKKKAELERLNELKNRMIGMAAHDLRSPLSVIRNYAIFLMEDDEQDNDLSDEQIELIEGIKSSSGQMARIIDHMLDISAIESGNFHIEKTERDLRELIKYAISQNRIPAENKKINLEERLPDHPVIREVDPHKFEQVLNNLISNAVKYSHPATTTTVGLTDVGEKEKVTVFVRDQGQGIPEEDLDKLFQPFEKVGVKPTAGEKSTGLGLAIAKKIVEGHNGTIRVESEVDKGTTFYIDLP